jgi:hypothetical protein
VDFTVPKLRNNSKVRTRQWWYVYQDPGPLSAQLESISNLEVGSSYHRYERHLRCVSSLQDFLVLHFYFNRRSHPSSPISKTTFRSLRFACFKTKRSPYKHTYKSIATVFFGPVSIHPRTPVPKTPVQEVYIQRMSFMPVQPK